MAEIDLSTFAAFYGFAGGIALGFASRWGRFCTLLAIEEAFFGHDTSKLRMWGWASAVALFGVSALVYFNLVDITASFYLTNPVSLTANAIGGILFGLGMSLVGTCGFGLLSRLGSGDMRSLLTFLIMGVTAYATLRGGLSYFRTYLTPDYELDKTPASFAHLVSDLTSLPLSLAFLVFAILIACASLVPFKLSSKQIIAGLIVGLVVTWGWFSTGYLLKDDFDPQPLVSYTFSAPLGETIMYFMTMTGSTINFGIGAVLGVISGAGLTSYIRGRFMIETCDDISEIRRLIIGGTLMGIGSVTALGCTIGQGISALSLTAFSAPITLAGIFLGAYIGLYWLIEGRIKLPFLRPFAGS